MLLYKEINQKYKINLFRETLRFQESRVERFVKYVQTLLITDWVQINDQQEFPKRSNWNVLKVSNETIYDKILFYSFHAFSHKISLLPIVSRLLWHPVLVCSEFSHCLIVEEKFIPGGVGSREQQEEQEDTLLVRSYCYRTAGRRTRPRYGNGNSSVATASSFVDESRLRRYNCGLRSETRGNLRERNLFPSTVLACSSAS